MAGISRISADSAIQESQVSFRKDGTITGGDNERVPVAEDVIGIHAAAPIAVGDGITLKKNTGILAKSGDRHNHGS